MSSPIRILLIALVVSLLSACAGGPPKRIYPPQARIQELVVQADGNWLLKLRVENFSTVPMTYSRIAADLSVNGRPAGRVDAAPALTVGPGSTEIHAHAFAPPSEARAALEAAVAGRTSLRYHLKGEITASEPRGSHDFDYESALDPVPGLPGVLR